MEELFKNPLFGQKNNFGAEDSQTDGVYFDVQNNVNPLAINLNGYDIKDSPFADNPIKEETTEQNKENNKENGRKKENEASKKRLNDLDLNILQDSAVKKAQEGFSGGNILGKILYKYFPKIYKSIIVRKGLRKLAVLNQTAKEIISAKSVPYGESDERYSALIEYLSSANTIHSRLIKKI